MSAILKREIKSFFITGAGYVFIGVFLLLSAVLFVINNLLPHSSDMSGFFSMTSYLWLLLSPILVMRLLAGERKRGTDQLLLTSPVGLGAVICAKYLSALVILITALALSVVFPIIVALYGSLYVPEILVGFLGVLLYASAYLAFSLFVSSFAKSPAAAFVMSLGANLLVRILGTLSTTAAAEPAARFLSTIDLDRRYLPFVYGQLSFAGITYFLLFTTICLIAAVESARALQGRRA